MEMQRVPEAGYPIEGLRIYGISRDFSLKGIGKNLKLPFVLMGAMRKAKRIIRDFNPDIAIGVGGFASGPALKMADKLGWFCRMGTRCSKLVPMCRATGIFYGRNADVPRRSGFFVCISPT